MKKIIMFFLLGILLLISVAACAVQDTSMYLRLSQTASGRDSNYVTELSEGWKFGGNKEDASGRYYNDASWAVVNIPHTWNVEDGADGNNNYKRTSFWYRKYVDITIPLEGKRFYLEFLGSNQVTDLYVNGIPVKLAGSGEYSHKGGYTAFRFDITNAVRKGQNTFAVKVDNQYSEEIAPVSGDFNMYGGIYRRVYMVVVNDVHVDLSEYGSSGLFLTTPNIRSKTRPADLGKLNIRANIINDSENDKKITVIAHIEGDNAPDDIQVLFNIPAKESATFNQTIFIEDPHLWQGIDYTYGTDDSDIGYLYKVTLTVYDNHVAIDTVSDTVGFRYFYVDKETGFYLNGKSHPLRGVNRHQFKQSLGSAMKEADHKEDIDLIKEMGANTIRLCHYPQTDYFYDLCDMNGIILWTEIPLVNLEFP